MSACRPAEPEVVIMAEKITNKKYIFLFILLCSAVYFISYLTRKNYDAALVEIYTSLNIPKTLAGLASTGAVITYGTGQLLSGVLGDRFKPKYIIVTGLVITAVCNFAIPVVSANIYLMIAVWCVNGLAQAMMWPPIVRIMSDLLDNDNFKKAVLYVTIASALSTITVYILVPVCINFSRWQTAFFISSAAAVIICLIWISGMRFFEKQVDTPKSSENISTVKTASVKLDKKYIFISGLIPIALGIILQGTLRDGVTTWMPSIISETYNLETSVSILSTVALPLLAIFSSTAASAVQRKLKNEVSSAALLYIISFASAVILTVFSKTSVILSIGLMAVITACMHGINLMLVCEVPNYFSKFNKVSTVSGILNSFTYIGSAISIYAIAAIAEKFNDWKINFLIWSIISILGVFCCFAALKKWKAFRNSSIQSE